MQDINCGKYHTLYLAEYDTAQQILCEEPGRLQWAEADYQAFIYREVGVTLVFYPHTTSSTGNKHIRVRNQGSRDKARAEQLMQMLPMFPRKRKAA